MNDDIHVVTPRDQKDCGLTMFQLRESNELFSINEKI